MVPNKRSGGGRVFLYPKSTIKDVAQKAGVSTQTVSRVINDRPEVAPETRRRVLDTIAALGYRPSALARSLIRQRSHTLGVITAGLNYIGPSRTLNGITGQAETMGYELLLEELPSFDHEGIQPLLQSLLAHRVDGVIWAVPEIGRNRERIAELEADIPVPVVFLAMRALPGLTVVACDNHQGGMLATQHLMDSGRREIGHVAGPQEWWEAQQRRAAWQDALTRAGRAMRETHWVEGNWSPASGGEAFIRLLDAYPEMDAVFVANDQMALAVLREAHRLGLRVPQDLAVAGFDDIAESAYFIPSLTTVRQDQIELGARAVRELVARVDAAHQGQTIEPQAIMLAPELVRRESA